VTTVQPDTAALLAALRARGGDGRITHVERLPARSGTPAAWPDWVPAGLRSALTSHGVAVPWRHQAEAATLAWDGRHVVLATGTASGKSLAYQLPVLARLLTNPRTTALYLAPTKALAADQLRVLDELAVPGVVATTYDGDTPNELRDMARAHATYLLTNPDMLHRSILPGHHRWSGFLRSLRFVVVDECHTYRGVFGSHVAHVLRRLRRVCAEHGADPVFVLASATTADPAMTAGRLTGTPVVPVTVDGSPRGSKSFLLWEPPLVPAGGPAGGQRRRGAVAETADLLTDLVVAGARTVAFVRSRRAAETVADLARASLAEVDPSLRGTVASYRSGYLPRERRDLESALQDGRLQGVAATTALELGVDVSGLDAVLIAGWPGTRASLWQQAGRAGRSGRESVAVLIGRDDPLDAYLVQHPDAVFGQPVEATVLDPDNPYVLAPHLCAAAAERPLTGADTAIFGPAAPAVIDTLVEQRLLRRRGTSEPTWHWTRRDRAADLADLRGSGGRIVSLVEQATGRLLGTVDSARAHSTAHPGAVYLHQGESYLVESLDLDDGIAMVRRDAPDFTTTAREVSSLRILEEMSARPLGRARLCFGSVEVSSQVVGFLRREIGTGAVLGEEPLDLPERRLRTRAVWWTVSADVVAAAGVASPDVAGSAHAAEHASIGMLPLVASCDRWDIGGLSTTLHPDTGMTTVFVHDGHAGGAGFAERGFTAAAAWLGATRTTVAECPCQAGCPSCVQSPKCGNGNEPLDKAGAVRLLDALVGG
jgi:DEAD/DEAH box helicase domain-containing protein